MKRLTISLLLLLAVQAAMGGGVVLADDRDAAFVTRHGISPTADSIAEYLEALHPDADTARRLETWFAQLGHDDFATREAATQRLMLAVAIPPAQIRAAVESKDPEVRWRARQVQLRGNKVDLTVLRAVLRVIARERIEGLAEPVLKCAPFCVASPRDRTVRRALLATATKADAAVLRQALKSPQPETRCLAAVTLQATVGAQARSDIHPLLVDDNERVRLVAAISLTPYDAPGAVRTFGGLLGSDDFRIRASSVQYLRSMTDQWFGFAVHDQTDGRTRAAARWVTWIDSHAETAELRPPETELVPSLGRTLVCFRQANRVIELDVRLQRTWEQRVSRPCGCHGLLNGHRLVASYDQRKVMEFDAQGRQIWEARTPGRPFSVRRLENGNTLVACTTARLVVELDAQGRTVWQARVDGEAMDARRLPNGHTMVALQGTHRVVEIDVAGKPVRKLEGLATPRAVQPLENGHLLIAETDAGRLIEVDWQGNIHWSRAGSTRPCDVQRLPGGNTLFTETRGVGEITIAKKHVWGRQARDAVAICRY